MDWRFTQYLCPACKYDVRQTLDDGFGVCPECGAAIDWETCDRAEQPLGFFPRLLIYAVWLSPTLVLPVQAAALANLALAVLVLPVTLLSLTGVLATWIWIEHRTGSPDPVGSALGPAIGTVCANLAVIGLLLCAGIPVAMAVAG